MTKSLVGEKIAVLVANGFSEKDLILTQKALQPYGANIRIVSMSHGLVNSWNEEGWGLNFAADNVLSQALAADYDILVVPGGQRSIDKLQLTAHTRRFIGGFVDSDKPVVFFDDAVELLAFAERASGRNVSGPDRVKDVLENAGAVVCEDKNVVDRCVMSGVSDEETRGEYTQAVVRFLVENGEDCADNVAEAVAA